jgi:hypothetical protein
MKALFQKWGLLSAGADKMFYVDSPLSSGCTGRL